MIGIHFLPAVALAAIAFPVELPDSHATGFLAAAVAAGGPVVLGVHVGPVDPALASHLHLEPNRGILVLESIRGRPAARAGIERFDVITSVGGKEVSSSDSLREALSTCEPGDTLTLIVLRGDETHEIQVQVEEGEEIDVGAPSESETQAALKARKRALEADLSAHAASRERRQALTEEHAALVEMLRSAHADQDVTAQHRAALEAELAAAAHGEELARAHGGALEEREQAMMERERAVAAHHDLLAALERQHTHLTSARDRIESEAQELHRKLTGDLHAELESLGHKLSEADRKQLEERIVAAADQARSHLLAARDRLRMPLVEIAPEGAVVLDEASGRGESVGPRLDAIEERLARIESKLDALAGKRAAKDN